MSIYPRLLDKCRIKGCENDFFLLFLDSFKEFSINSVQTSFLLHCDGVNEIDEICKIVSISKDAGIKFVESMVEIDAVEVSNSLGMRSSPELNVLDVKYPYLKEVHLDITSKCNLKCPHCYQEPYLKSEIKEMTSEEIFKVIDEMIEMNVSKLVISGGEAFLRKDLMEIIDYAFKGGIIAPTIFTNGTIINQSYLSKICDYGSPISLAISLDGPDPKTNDFIRGEGSFEKTIEFVKRVLKKQEDGSKVVIVIDSMVHPLNFDRLKEFFIYLSELGVQRWRMSMPRSQGAYMENKHKISVPISQVLEEYEKFIDWYLEEGRLISGLDIQIESFFRSALFEEDRTIAFFNNHSFCCEYKKNALAIKPNGDVTICTAFTDLSVGNVNKDSLREIWYSPKMQKIKQIKVGEVEECEGCDYVYLCGTGCRRMAFAEKGSILSKDESVCEVYSFFHYKIIPKLNIFNKNK